jgi:O-antigen/teichoic acid export membrane protein
LLRNSGFLMGTTVATSALGYAYWLLAAHNYSSSEVGLAAGAISTFTLVGYVLSLGVAPAYVRMLPRFREPAEVAQFFASGLVATVTASVVAGSAVVALLPIWAHHFDGLRQTSLAAAFIAGCGLTTACIAIDGCFVALRRSSRQFGRNLAFAATKMGLLLLPVVLLRQPDSASILWTWDGAQLLSAVLALVLLHRLGLPLTMPGMAGLRRLLLHRHTMLGYQIGSLGAWLPPFVFPVLVIGLVGTRENAYVYFTWSVAGLLFMISTSIGLALFAEGSNQEDLRRQTVLAAKVMLIALVPLTAVVLLLAHRILLLFGSEYAVHGTALLRIFALGALADAVTNCYVGLRNAQHRLAEVAGLNLTMAVVAIAGAAALLPTWGIDAVAWSWTSAQFVGCLWVVVVLLHARRANHQRHVHEDVDGIQSGHAQLEIGEGVAS